MKQPKNSLLAIMLLMNIALTMIVLFTNSNVKLEETAYADSLLESDVEQANRKKDEQVSPNEIEEAEEEVLYDIQGVTSYESELPTMDLFYHHSNEEGYWFTYKPLEEGEQWDSGFWFVDYATLNEAKIGTLEVNESIEAIFYDGEYFEIKEVSRK